ncbi:MAG: FG-GAP-like repeat-containing protein [Planctomycetota bacterium]
MRLVVPSSSTELGPFVAVLAALTVLTDLTGPLAAQTPLLVEPHRMVPADQARARAIAFADLDGDLDLDVLIGTNAGLPIAVYGNDGNGGLFLGTTLDVGLKTVRGLALGHIDADPHLDLLVGAAGPCGFAPCSEAENALFLGSGTGGFVPAAGLPAVLDDTWDAALADVDGDGDLDGLFGNRDAQNRLVLGDGSGGFAEATVNLPPAVDDTRALVAFDADGDGDVDVAFANWLEQNRLLRGVGGGLFSDATAALPVSSAASLAILAGDADADGDLDLLLADGVIAAVWENDGAGGFTAGAGSVSTGAQIRDLALIDVDGDADLDLLVASDLQNRLLLNDGAAGFSPAPTELPALVGDTEVLAAGDLDGDLDADVLAAVDTSDDFSGFGNGETQLYLGDGKGAFAFATRAEVPFYDESRAVALADLDGDADLDAFVGNQTKIFGLATLAEDRVLKNDGFGVLSHAPGALPALDQDTRSVVLADFDGDADVDAFVGTGAISGDPYGLSLGTQNRLLVNAGTATFTDATAQLPAEIDSVSEGAAGDLDGDGDLDLLVATRPYSVCCGYPVDNANRLYLNDGAGLFTARHGNLPATGTSEASTAAALGDVDADGDLDALIGTSNGLDHLYLNDGAAGFVDATGNLPAIGDSDDLALGDADGDGDLDLALYGDELRLYLGDGAGLFTAGGSFPTGLPSGNELLWSDLDGDQDLDLVLASSDENQVLLNDGAGAFTALGLGALDEGTFDVAAGDLDADGDDDLLFVGWAQNRLYVNRTRQVSWRHLPRVGKPLFLDLADAPGTPWFLAWAPATASVPLPPYGLLGLDPAALQVLGSGSFDGAGNAELVALVPATPPLVGADLYVQMLAGAPLILSNVERVALTDF